MILKKPLKKVRQKKLSKKKIIDNIIKYETEKQSELIQIMKRKPQIRHQFYSDNAVIIHEDDEKYIGLFPLMEQYNKIHNINISKYNEKKNENKDFLKHYTGYKLYNKNIFKDDTGSVFGNILPLYNKKNFFFSDKFLSGKKIFQESGLLIQNKRHLREYYKKVRNLSDNKAERDIAYINHLNVYLEEKIEKNKLKDLEKDIVLMEKVGKVNKKVISTRLAKYKRSREYKINKRKEAMKALELFRNNQMKIENDKEYIKNITKLIEFEEKEREKQKEMDTTNGGQSMTNLENEDNNSLFILNRYQNNRYNNKINATKILPKNRSSINIQSSLYKETTNSTTNINNETKQTVFNNRNTFLNKTRNNIKKHLNISEYTMNDTHENKDNTEYININDTYNENPINFFGKLKQNSINETSTKFKSKYKSNRNISRIKFERNDDTSTISHNEFDKTKNYFISDHAKKSAQKRGRNSIHPISNIKSTFGFTKFSDKSRDQNNNSDNSINMNKTLNMKGKGDLKWKLFMNLNKINNYVFMRNNREFKHFCDNSNFIPNTLTSKIEQSFELDDELKKAQINYVKLLMEQKIMKYFDKDLLYNY